MNKDYAAEKIMKFIQEETMTKFPAFPEAFALMPFQAYQLKDAALSTDGKFLFYNPHLVCELFQYNSEQLRLMFLHTHLHVLLGHNTRSNEVADDLFFDNEVNHLISLLVKNSSSFHQMFLSDSHEKWLIHESAEKNLRLEHPRITGTNNNSIPLSALHGNPLLNRDNIKNKIFKTVKENESNKNGKHGSSPGRYDEAANLQKRDSMDYSRFLQRFTVPREEAILDTDSFDYIPYHYGLTYYENLPFIEPLEYKEVNRLDELAIAIDTSGSCSGVIVRRFLEETWNILRQRENFFSKMRLHLIQCDCMVQEHRIFTSVEEWEEAVPNLQIHGHGDTDFQPVFSYLEKLIEQGEIRQLRGLLFFTDGDGIYPSHRPSFDTAFVFLNQETEKHDIPDWGIRLNLNLPDVF